MITGGHKPKRSNCVDRVAASTRGEPMSVERDFERRGKALQMHCSLKSWKRGIQ